MYQVPGFFCFQSDSRLRGGEVMEIKKPWQREAVLEFFFVMHLSVNMLPKGAESYLYELALSFK
jgi:hypothetical protein